MKNNYFRKSTNSKPKETTPIDIQLPIQLTQASGSNLWTWEYGDQQMRNHFASGFWYSQDGKNVFWGWQELKDHTITSIKKVDILMDATSGRQYVEVKRKDKPTWKQYLDEAVCICFHGRPENPNQHVNHKDGNICNCNADNLEWE